MEEKALLVEIEKDKEKVIEQKLEEQRKRYHDEIVTNETKPQDMHLFSSKTYPSSLPKLRPSNAQNTETPKVNQSLRQEVKQSEASKVIEKPNYDLMEELSESEREKVYVIEKDKPASEPAKKPSLFKKIALAVLFGIFGIWGIVNITQIDLISSQVADVSSEYSMNLVSYLNNLKNLDATNSNNMQNLLDTIPDQELKPSGIERQSNWFDRFCNFLGGIFGG